SSYRPFIYLSNCLPTWPRSPATSCCIIPSIARRSGSLSGGGFCRRLFGPRPPGSRFFLAIGHTLEDVQAPCAHCSRTPGSRFLGTVFLVRRLHPSRRHREQPVQLPQPLTIPLVTGQTPRFHDEIEPVGPGRVHRRSIQRQITNRYCVW